jgi:hypothetical protein
MGLRVELWVREMGQSIEGSIIILNLLYDLRRADATVALNFLNALNSRLEESNVSALQVYEDVINSCNLCEGAKTQENFSNCSRIIDISTFIRHNLDTNKVPLPITNIPLTEEQIDLLEQVDLGVAGKGTMRTRREFAWVTKSNYVEQLKISNSTEIATTLRNALGLANYTEQYQFIEIRYPPETGCLESQFIARPSFVEGGMQMYYRSVAREEDGWGQTINLSNCENGGPEAVHPSVEFGVGFKLVKTEVGLTQPLVDLSSCQGELLMSQFEEYDGYDFVERLLTFLNSFIADRENYE